MERDLHLAHAGVGLCVDELEATALEVDLCDLQIDQFALDAEMYLGDGNPDRVLLSNGGRDTRRAAPLVLPVVSSMRVRRLA
jgi:hypothetical protein